MNLRATRKPMFVKVPVHESGVSIVEDQDITLKHLLPMTVCDGVLVPRTDTPMFKTDTKQCRTNV